MERDEGSEGATGWLLQTCFDASLSGQDLGFRV